MWPPDAWRLSFIYSASTFQDSTDAISAGIVVDPMQGLRGAFAPQVICKMSVTSFKKEVGKATNFLSFFARTFDLAVCRFQSRTFGFAFS